MKKSNSNKKTEVIRNNNIIPLLQNIRKFKKEIYLIKMGLCPKPRDLTHFGQKHGKRAAQEVLPPCLRHQLRRSGCFPAVALSSELVVK